MLGTTCQVKATHGLQGNLGQKESPWLDERRMNSCVVKVIVGHMWKLRTINILRKFPQSLCIGDWGKRDNGVSRSFYVK